MEALVEELRGRGYAPATVKRKLDMVSKALRMATIWSDESGRPLLTAKPPMPSIRVANLKDRVLHSASDAKLLGVADEEEALWSALEKRKVAEPGRQWHRLGGFLRFLLDTGARLTEALNVGPKDISFRPTILPDGSIVQRPVVTFPRYGTKSDKPRTVPLTDAAWAAVQSQREFMGIRKVATTEGKVEKLCFFPMTQGTVWYMFQNLKDDMAKAGVNISDVTLHTLRHTCLTRLARGGMDLLRLQQWAGHSDPKITADRYAHLIPSNLMDGLLMLGSSNGATAPTQESNDNMPLNGVSTDGSANRVERSTPLLN